MSTMVYYVTISWWFCYLSTLHLNHFTLGLRQSQTKIFTLVSLIYMIFVLQTQTMAGIPAPKYNWRYLYSGSEFVALISHITRTYLYIYFRTFASFRITVPGEAISGWYNKLTTFPSRHRQSRFYTGSRRWWLGGGSVVFKMACVLSTVPCAETLSVGSFSRRP